MLPSPGQETCQSRDKESLHSMSHGHQVLSKVKAKGRSGSLSVLDSLPQLSGAYHRLES